MTEENKSNETQPQADVSAPVAQKSQSTQSKAKPGDDFDWSIDDQGFGGYSAAERQKMENLYTETLSQLNEGELVKELLQKHPEAVNLTGKLSLQQFIAFISHCDALIAASTGPLHIASALGKKAIGLFSPMRPIHPGRWKPIGVNAHYLVLDKECTDCKKNKDCHCIREIPTTEVIKVIET